MRRVSCRIQAKTHDHQKEGNDDFNTCFHVIPFQILTSLAHNVAFVARLGRKDGMNVTFKVLRVQGGMRVMAFPAIHHSRIYVDMRAIKCFRLIVVALTAERLNLLGEQGRLCGIMGLVTALAIPRRR